MALQGIAGIEVRAGRLPYFFQLAAAEEARRTFLQAQTAHGEVVLRDGCAGTVLASRPLPEAPDADGFISMQLPLPAGRNQASLCIQFSGDTRPMFWVLDQVRLLTVGIQ